MPLREFELICYFHARVGSRRRGQVKLTHTSLLALGPACSTGHFCLGTNMSASVSPHFWAIW